MHLIFKVVVVFKRGLFFLRRPGQGDSIYVLFSRSSPSQQYRAKENYTSIIIDSTAIFHLPSFQQLFPQPTGVPQKVKTSHEILPIRRA